MAGKVVVCCKLPAGIVLDHPMDPNKKVALNGANRAQIIGADHGKTEVDEDFWKAWSTVHADFAPLKSGAIFVAKDAASAEAKAKENKGRKTGFEQMPKEAQGVKPADKE